MRHIAVMAVAVLALGAVAAVLANGIGAVKNGMVVIDPSSQAGEVVGFAIANTTANEDTIQVQVHLQGAEPNARFKVQLRNVFYPKKNEDDPIWIEVVKNAGEILTDSEGNGNSHAVTHVLEYGYADWVDMKVWAVAPGIKYSAWYARPDGTELPPKP